MKELLIASIPQHDQRDHQQEVVQRSPEWFCQRIGKVTASNLWKVCAVKKDGNPLKEYENYLFDLITERLIGQITEQPITPEMRWGIQYEPEALQAYAQENWASRIDSSGFVHHPHIALSGASPDGLIDADGLVEIKCPTKRTHLRFLISKEINLKYVLQMQWQMACTGRKWCDFASYHPEFPESNRLICKTILRDEAQIASLEEKVNAFLDAIQTTLDNLTNGAQG